MPKKKTTKSSSSSEAVKCTVCEQKVVEGEEQALFCEGACKQWVHRYCAGIPVTLFASLSSSTAPFWCYTCSQHNHATEIAKLTEVVSTLQKEVADLRNDLIAAVKLIHCLLLHLQRLLTAWVLELVLGWFSTKERWTWWSRYW